MQKTIALFLSSCLAFPAIGQDAPKPKLGSDAVPITADNAYLRASPAVDFWAFSPFVKPQFTSSACSIASVNAALNGLLGLPEGSEDSVISQSDLLTLVDDKDWSALSAEGGAGVTFDQLYRFTEKAILARQMTAFHAMAFRPAADDAATGAALRLLLAKNEASSQDALLAYFNQGVVTGDWDGPHISIIGAYDAARDRVLILEVDQEWYIPYWTPTKTLLAAMLKPAPADQAPLDGQTGGLVHILK